eukprot:1568593-Lingulodinium_polyedra.AAC.1
MGSARPTWPFALLAFLGSSGRPNLPGPPGPPRLVGLALLKRLPQRVGPAGAGWPDRVQRVAATS